MNSRRRSSLHVLLLDDFGQSFRVDVGGSADPLDVIRFLLGGREQALAPRALPRALRVLARRNQDADMLHRNHRARCLLGECSDEVVGPVCVVRESASAIVGLTDSDIAFVRGRIGELRSLRVRRPSRALLAPRHRLTPTEFDLIRLDREFEKLQARFSPELRQLSFPFAADGGDLLSV